jgi:electron transfer flavoprotein alpha/beta subunit
MIEFILEGREGQQKLEAIKKVNAALRPQVLLVGAEPVDEKTGQLPGLPPPVNAKG